MATLLGACGARLGMATGEAGNMVNGCL